MSVGLPVVEQRMAYVDPPGTTAVTDPAVASAVLDGVCPDCRLPLLSTGGGWLLCSGETTRFTAHPHYRVTPATPAEFDAIYGRCAYPSEDPRTDPEDWEECDLQPGHVGDHGARLMFWPTRSEDEVARTPTPMDHLAAFLIGLYGGGFIIAVVLLAIFAVKW